MIKMYQPKEYVKLKSKIPNSQAYLMEIGITWSAWLLLEL